MVSHQQWVLCTGLSAVQVLLMCDAMPGMQVFNNAKAQSREGRRQEGGRGLSNTQAMTAAAGRRGNAKGVQQVQLI